MTIIGDAADEPDETVAVVLNAPVNATLTAAAATGTGTITDDDEPGLWVGTAGRPGTTERRVNGHVVTVVEGEGVPAGAVVVLPDALDRDVVLRFSPPGAGVPLESARFGLGETADRGTVVGVTAEPVPAGGWNFVCRCPPVCARRPGAGGCNCYATVRPCDADLHHRSAGPAAGAPEGRQRGHPAGDLSRAMAASTVDAVAGRIGQALFPDGAGATAPADALAAFAGVVQVNEQAIEDGEWSWKQGLDGQSFAFALSGGGGDGAAAGSATGGGARGGVTVWGAGDYRSLSGGEGSGVDWDGHLFGAHLGLDARFGVGGLTGLALSVSEGRFEYFDASVSVPGEAVEGEYESGMTSVHPQPGVAGTKRRLRTWECGCPVRIARFRLSSHSLIFASFFTENRQLRDFHRHFPKNS